MNVGPRSRRRRPCRARPGREGDFLTAPEAHPIFGRTLSRAVADAWDRLGRPDPFVVREHGAGTGAMALAILDGLAAEHPDLAATVRYEPVEVDPRRLATLAGRLAAGGHESQLAVPAGPDAPDTPAAPNVPVTGFFIANEVLDALPTHRLVQRDGVVREVRVGVDAASFIDVETELSTPALAARLADEGVRLRDDQQAEVCLELQPWIEQAAAGLRRGVLLLIDYGYPAHELYDPVRRRDGTLRAYLRHRVHDDPYVHVGRQDLTTHVDVTAVERAAAGAGLDHLGTTTQAEFLVGLGAEDLLRAIQADPATTMEAYLEVRSAVIRLLDPGAMGRFRVMAFGRGWPAGPPLAGLAFRGPR